MSGRECLTTGHKFDLGGSSPPCSTTYSCARPADCKGPCPFRDSALPIAKGRPGSGGLFPSWAWIRAKWLTCEYSRRATCATGSRLTETKVNPHAEVIRPLMPLTSPLTQLVSDLSTTGTDNLFHTERVRWTLRLEAFNITNKEAAYNFLSTCSGTHFVEPRSYRATLGIAF